MDIQPKFTPVLDPAFVAPVLWNKAFADKVAATPGSHTVDLALTRLDGTCFRWSGKILPQEGENIALNNQYIERIVKFLLWMKGGCTIMVAGDDQIADMLAATYCAGGAREFDWDFIGKKIYDQPIQVVKVASAADLPAENSTSVSLGRNLDGYRIGFDLGGSDRKAAAMIDGEVVFSEEIAWDPYFQQDPSYHKEGILDSLKRAAAHLPRVDAIGGSTAGVIVQNRVRISSLFRGVPKQDFESKVANIFLDVAKEMGVPFEIVNDGEVTALAGSMQLNSNSILGVSLGTSMAGGYVNPDGNITDWLNELAFVPIDYRDGAPADEWSGDLGCGVQFFSQQGVARLAPLAGIEFPAEMKFPERLIGVQKLMEEGDPRAEKIYRSIGVAFGYTIARFCDFYPEIKSVLFLGRVTSGKGGDIIQAEAENVIKTQFPEYTVVFEVPDEKTKRHGQAIAAASLPMA